MEQTDIDKRFATYAPDPAKTQLENTIRNVIKAAASAINTTVPESREKVLAVKALEDAMYWACAGIQRNVEIPVEGA